MKAISSVSAIWVCTYLGLPLRSHRHLSVPRLHPLGVTQRGAPVDLAGLAIGLTLIAIHLWGLMITGTSLNPARSLGPALIGAGTKPEALAQVWLFIVAPLIGGAIAGFLFKPGGALAADDEIPSRGGAKISRPRHPHRANAT